MSVIKGLDVLIKVGGQIIGGQRGCSIDLTSESIDASVKQNNGWSTKIGGLKSWTASCDGVYFVDDAGIQAIYDAFEAGETVELEFSNTAGIYQKGEAMISSINIEAGQDDVVSYQMSFEGCGALSFTK